MTEKGKEKNASVAIDLDKVRLWRISLIIYVLKADCYSGWPC